MDAKLDLKDEDVYTTFDKKLRRALERQVQQEIKRVKIVDFSKYGDKHFKLHKMKSNVKLHQGSGEGVESFLPTINDSTRAFIYNTVIGLLLSLIHFYYCFFTTILGITPLQIN